ncbi:MAG: aminotransferase class V-fold PLP-dependent enzyme [Actinomycetes bacterium]
MPRGYLDAASGQPLHPAARTAAAGFSDRVWADPSMPHHEGRTARQVLEAARATVAEVIGTDPSSVGFLRAGHDVAMLAVEGLAAGANGGHRRQTVHVYTSAVERSAVLEVADTIGGAAGTHIIEVDRVGRISDDAFRAALAITPVGDTRIAVFQAANIELGTRQPLASLLGTAAAEQIPVAIDGTGALGWIDIDPGWSALFADAQGFAGPRGAAILAVEAGARWRLPSPQADHTRPPEPDDVAAAVKTAAALDGVYQDRIHESARLSELVQRIRDRVRRTVPDVELLGDADNRLPYLVTFSCLYVDGERLAMELDRLGFAVGSGSACASRTGLPSHVLTAIGSLTHGNVRISLPIGCLAATVDAFLAVLPEAVARVRAEAGAP